MQPNGSTKHAALCAELDSAQAAVTSAQSHLLGVIAECDREEIRRTDGCRDLAQWLSGRLGISNWAARRWINAAQVLPTLPLVSAALEAGTLSLDKVVELCRVATPETERRLISWARRVTVAGIRRRADLATRGSVEDVVESDRSRYLRHWWFDDGKRLGLEGALPADQDAVVARALDRLADRTPDIIEDDDDERYVTSEDALEVRRADALVAMASRAIAEDQDADRATVVVHRGPRRPVRGRGELRDRKRARDPSGDGAEAVLRRPRPGGRARRDRGGGGDRARRAHPAPVARAPASSPRPGVHVSGL
jgi:hypothetical protein